MPYNSQRNNFPSFFPSTPPVNNNSSPSSSLSQKLFNSNIHPSLMRNIPSTLSKSTTSLSITTSLPPPKDKDLPPLPPNAQPKHSAFSVLKTYIFKPLLTLSPPSSLSLNSNSSSRSSTPPFLPNIPSLPSLSSLISIHPSPSTSPPSTPPLSMTIASSISRSKPKFLYLKPSTSILTTPSNCSIYQSSPSPPSSPPPSNSSLDSPPPLPHRHRHHHHHPSTSSSLSSHSSSPSNSPPPSMAENRPPFAPKFSMYHSVLLSDDDDDDEKKPDTPSNHSSIEFNTLSQPSNLLPPLQIIHQTQNKSDDSYSPSSVNLTPHLSRRLVQSNLSQSSFSNLLQLPTDYQFPPQSYSPNIPPSPSSCPDFPNFPHLIDTSLPPSLELTYQNSDSSQLFSPNTAASFFPDDYETTCSDDENLISQANLEALANDPDGSYAQEFQLYPSPDSNHFLPPQATDSSLIRPWYCLRPPNLSPITECSESSVHSSSSSIISVSNACPPLDRNSPRSAPHLTHLPRIRPDPLNRDPIVSQSLDHLMMKLSLTANGTTATATSTRMSNATLSPIATINVTSTESSKPQEDIQPIQPCVLKSSSTALNPCKSPLSPLSHKTSPSTNVSTRRSSTCLTNPNVDKVMPIPLPNPADSQMKFLTGTLERQYTLARRISLPSSACEAAHDNNDALKHHETMKSSNGNVQNALESTTHPTNIKSVTPSVVNSARSSNSNEPTLQALSLTSTTCNLNFPDSPTLRAGVSVMK